MADELKTEPTLNKPRVASGQSSRDWKAYTAQCVFLDVDTTAAGFTKTPVYVTSIGGDEEQWLAAGVQAIYPIPPAKTPSAAGFRVYVRRRDGALLSPEEAQKKGWHIDWIGVEP